MKTYYPGVEAKAMYRIIRPQTRKKYVHNKQTNDTELYYLDDQTKEWLPISVEELTDAAEVVYRQNSKQAVIEFAEQFRHTAAGEPSPLQVAGWMINERIVALMDNLTDVSELPGRYQAKLQAELANNQRYQNTEDLIEVWRTMADQFMAMLGTVEGMQSKALAALEAAPVTEIAEVLETMKAQATALAQHLQETQNGN